MKRSGRPPSQVSQPVLRSVLICAVFVLMVLIARPATLGAQVLYGSLVGNVTDEIGGAMPGATVVIVHTETGASHEALTNAAGAYRFSTLQPGTYTMTVKLTGFRTVTREQIPVTLNNV